MKGLGFSASKQQHQHLLQQIHHTGYRWHACMAIQTFVTVSPLWLNQMK